MRVRRRAPSCRARGGRRAAAGAGSARSRRAAPTSSSSTPACGRWTRPGPRPRRWRSPAIGSSRSARAPRSTSCADADTRVIDARRPVRDARLQRRAHPPDDWRARSSTASTSRTRPRRRSSPAASASARGATPKGEWMLGGNWDEQGWTGAPLPTRDSIDERDAGHAGLRRAATTSTCRWPTPSRCGWPA